jgi:5-formyltetrahydrofolate cyclo-ligase
MRSISLLETRDSQPVCRALDECLSARPELRTIAVFSALPGEPDLTELTTLPRPGLRWGYPRVDGEQLTFHIVADPAQDLIPGAFGILEPAPGLPEVRASEIDAFFCPGLAFDPQGGRLGRGRGFYDRLLSKGRPDALKIGGCFPHQLVPDTHSEPHDIAMDLVISG